MVIIMYPIIMYPSTLLTFFTLVSQVSQVSKVSQVSQVSQVRVKKVSKVLGYIIIGYIIITIYEVTTEVSIRGAGQKDRGLWERECQ